LRVDPGNVCVWRGTKAIRLTPKAFAVLWYLVEHPGRVITKDELFETVWPGTVVSEGALTVCMSALRKALGDTAQAPQFIETVHRLGYRFIGPITLDDASEITSTAASLSPSVSSHPPLLAGREAALVQLHARLTQARCGTRQVVFVTGEPGIGKTTLVQAFLAQTAALTPMWITQGQCIEHYGAGEAYLPVLDALGQLCRGPDGRRIVEVLSQQAPTWLVQMPALLHASELEALHRRVLGATRQRMLRELGEAIEVLTSDAPLVLVLEDLHWSDSATLDLVSWLARRRQPARLLLLSTYRPVEVIVRGHPLRGLVQALQLHQQCTELPLELLTEAEVAQYLAARFREPAVAAALAWAVHRHTSGNPLFMVAVVDALVQQGVVQEGGGQWRVQTKGAVVEGVPENLRQMIEQRFDELSTAEQRVLEAASVAGMVYSAAAVAAGVAVAVEDVEAQCAGLARRGQFLQDEGVEEWPDGTIAGRYRFRHALCQHVVYERLTPALRLRLHRQIGARMATGYREQAREHAAELAEHFMRGRDDQQALSYLRQAGENALRRRAYAEAMGHLMKGLEVLQRLPETPERAQQELEVQIMLGAALLATKGTAAPEVGAAYRRAQVLCTQRGELPQLFGVLRGLRRFHLGRGELPAAQALAEQCLSLAERMGDAALLAEAHAALGIIAFHRGELAIAHGHLVQGMAYGNPLQFSTQELLAGLDPGVSCLTHGALVLWLQGYADRALQQVQRGLALAHTLAHPFTLAAALNYAAILHLLRGEWQAVQEHARAAVTLAATQGFPLWMAQGTLLQGWVLASQGQGREGLEQMQQGLAGWRAAGQMEGQTFWLALLAEQYAHDGQIEAGLAILTDALAVVHTYGLCAWEPELYRLQGELLWRQAIERDGRLTGAVGRAAEACFRQALDIARRQGARAWELRAALGLSRLWQQQGQTDTARQLLTEIYGCFTEGFDTADWRATRALLDEIDGTY
jgi:predicted ATPase